ncbi:MAG: hypothetical protein AAF984_08685, partial [Verrucomicrobiota bacterium]
MSESDHGKNGKSALASNGFIKAWGPSFLEKSKKVAMSLMNRKDSSSTKKQRKSDKILDAKEKLGPLLGTLEEERTQLNQLPQLVEEKVQYIGDQLQIVHEDSLSLVRHSESLLEMAIGRDDDQTGFQEAIDNLHEPLKFLERAKSQDKELIRNFQQHIGGIQSMLRSEESLDRTMRPLKYLQTMFKIESATLSQDVQEVFLGLTKDIEKLHVEVAEIFSSKFRELEGTQNTLNAVSHKFTSQMQSQHIIADQRKKQIEDSLVGLTEDLKINQESDVRMTKFSQAVVQAVGEVVIGLQFHDIIAQKGEHVIEALNDLEGKYEELIRIGETQQAVEILRSIYQTAALQRKQLEVLINDLIQSQNKIMSGMEDICERTQEADQECLQLTEFGRVSAGVDGMVQVLLDAYRDVRDLIQKFVQLIAETTEKLRPLGGMASNLNQKIRELSAEIHLIALNAQVQAVRVQDGCGLETLASNTCMISTATLSISGNVSSELDKLVKELDKCVATCEDIFKEGDENRCRMNEEGAEREVKLHTYRDHTLALLIRVGHVVNNIETISRKTSKEIDFKSIADEHTEVTLATLDKVIEITEQALEDLSEEKWGDDYTDGLHNKYTMDSERKVHQQVFLETLKKRNELVDDYKEKDGLSIDME